MQADGSHPWGSNRTLLIALGAAVGLVALAAVLGAVLLGGGGGTSGSSDARAALVDAGCTLTVVKAVPNKPDHSDVKSPAVVQPAWNTFPPTSGPHYGQAALFGAYGEPLEQARVVHNLEHGGVYIQYGRDVPPAIVDELKAFYDRHQDGTLLAPLPKLGAKIALGAWNAPDAAGGGHDRGQGILATCSTFDETAYGAFFDAYQFKGPERFPASAMRPGT
jgi:hypothetical protein